MKQNIIATTRGYVANTNWSSIATILIKEAAKCDSYSSDIFYDLKAIEETVKNGNSETFLLGFRDMGVDSKAFVEVRLDSKEKVSSYYRKLMKLDIVADETYKSIKMDLYEMFE